MTPTRLALGLLLTLVFSATALASHYPLEAVSFIQKEHSDQFLKLKLDDTQLLLEALATPEKRKSIESKTGIAQDTLLFYAQLCDLLQIRGVGPQMARLLHLAGYTSVGLLAKATPAAALEAMKKANQEHRVSELLPQEPTMANWIEQAQKLPRTVTTHSPAPKPSAHVCVSNR